MKKSSNVRALPLSRLTPKPPRPPKGLSAESRRWWRSLQAEYGITDSAGLLLLQTAAEQFMRMRAEEATVDSEGSVAKDRFGQPKQHPAVLNAREARSAMLKCLQQLRLDVEPIRARPGRPGGR